MGEAYDRTGAFLGAAQAESASQVLKELQLKHKDAVDFRIRTFEQAENTSGPSTTRAVDRMEQFFAFSHLPPHLQAVSEPFSKLATLICDTLPGNPERTVALRKLLEAKDCAVRALLFK